MDEELAASRYEYEFVRFDCGPTGGPAAAAIENYQEVVDQHAVRGWRLVQIFAPATRYGAAFWELIFERPISQEPE